MYVLFEFGHTLNKPVASFSSENAFSKMILVEISDQNPLFFTDRVIVLMKGGAVRPGLLNHNKKTHLYRTRYRNGSYKTVIPTDGIFWPLFPDWYYDLEIDRVLEEGWNSYTTHT